MGEALSAAAGRLPQSALCADSPLLAEGAFGAEGGLGFGDALSIASIHFRAHLGHNLGQGSWVDLERFCRGIFILFYIGSEISVMPIHIKQRVKSKHKIEYDLRRSLLKEYVDTVHPIEQRQNRDYLFFTTLHDRRTRMLTRFVSMHGQIRRQSVAQSKKSLEIRVNVPFRLFGKTMRRWESAFMDWRDFTTIQQ